MLPWQLSDLLYVLIVLLCVFVTDSSLYTSIYIYIFFFFSSVLVILVYQVKLNFNELVYLFKMLLWQLFYFS